MKHRGGKETNVIGTAFDFRIPVYYFACLPVSMLWVWQ